MPIGFAALLVASHLVVPVVDQVPELNMTKICTRSTIADDPEKDQRNCLAFEQKAKLQLAMGWAQFAAADRSSCLQISSSAGMASYVEILTCLEMANHARSAPKLQAKGSLLSGEGAHRDFREGCPPKAGPARAELTPDSCF
jgi:hypothetical protein